MAIVHRPSDPRRFKVLKKRCDQCPFSKNQKTVPAERLADIKRTLERTQGPFICHKGLPYDLVCRGYYDTAGNLVIALARGLGIIEYMTLEEAEIMSRCMGHMRHWFTNGPGEYRPECRRCHAPNPRCPHLVDGERKPCGRKTGERGYCGFHGSASSAETVMRVNL